MDEEEEQEILEYNYKETLKRLKTIDIRLTEVNKLVHQIGTVITYGKDGALLDSISNKMDNSIRQAKLLEKRMKHFRTELVVPWKKIKK